MIKSLVISGGGSKGAFAGGVAEALYKTKQHTWNNFYGTSTGALLNTLIPQYRFKDLYNLYTNVNNKSIFNISPFDKNGKVRILNAIWRVLRNKTSLGETKNLYELITTHFTKQDYLELYYDKKIVCNCVTNYTKGRVEFKYNDLETYEDFCRYVLASASVPLAMDLVFVNYDEYLDGGVMEHIPLQRAIDDGSDEIDVIVLRPNYSEQLDDNWDSKNIFNVSFRTLSLMMKEISENDLFIGKLVNTLNKDININIFYLNKEVPINTLMFDPQQMKKWWNEGYKSVEQLGVKSYSFDTHGLHINKYFI